MFTKKMTYKDFTGESITETFMFNMNKAELFDWLICNGGLTIDELILKLQKKSRGKDILAIFKDLILSSYGEISDDKKRFVKSEQLSKDFSETEAFSDLYISLVTDAKAAAEFINGIMPDGLGDEIEKIIAENPDGIPEEVRDYLLGKTDAKPDLSVIPGGSNPVS